MRLQTIYEVTDNIWGYRQYMRLQTLILYTYDHLLVWCCRYCLHFGFRWQCYCMIWVTVYLLSIVEGGHFTQHTWMWWNNSAIGEVTCQCYFVQVCWKLNLDFFNFIWDGRHKMMHDDEVLIKHLSLPVLDDRYTHLAVIWGCKF